MVFTLWSLNKLREDWYCFNQKETEIWADENWDDSQIDSNWYVNWLKENPPRSIYTARILVPYKYLNVDLRIEPAKSIEWINVKFEV